MLKSILVAAVAMSAVSTCSSPNGESAETEQPPATTSPAAANSTVAPEPGNSSKRPPLDPAKFDLMYVRTSAPDCAAVWTAGGRLPGNYQWCSRDGEPVSGVRIGPCEVIVYGDALYAIPGRRIVAANGQITQDPAFNRARTSCKRHPAPIANGR